MNISMARYMTAPKRVNATVIDSLVGCGIISNTVAIITDARACLEMLFQGKWKTRHLRAIAYVTTSMAELASKVIKAR